MSVAVPARPLIPTPPSGRLPVPALLAFAWTGFIAILTETMPAGLLPQISNSLGVSQALAGQLVTAYAAGSLLASIPLTAATQGWRRRPVLLLSIGGFLIFNTVTALSHNYLLTLAARFLAGVAAGLGWGMIAGYARRLAPERLQGRALALAMVGTPIALSLGTPAGSLLGALAGWRVAFLVMSALCLLLVGWVLWSVPDLPGQEAHRRRSVWAVLLAPGIRPVLAVIFAWMLAHNILYTYVAPFVAQAGLGGQVDLVLLVFGAAALFGIWITGLIVDRWLRTSTLVSLSVFALVILVLAAKGHSTAVVFCSVAIWGLTFGGAATQLQTASADAADDGVDVAQAMVTTSWNMAIAGGGLVGGFLLTRFGAGSFPWAMLAAVAVALATTWRADRNGFPPGARRQSAS
jgi:predicted MFS family arabinose efflux permease